MRTFIIIWLGQLVSTFGSRMTSFALTIWAWELTGQATALALVSFFTILPRIFITLFAGTVVDRCNRKLLIALGDTVAAVSTFAILLLYLTENLQIWHLYVVGALNGAFSEIQELAYTASISLLVSKQQYTRASSMNSTIHYGAIITAPALAGALYYIIGFVGIALIDIVTFAIAISTVLIVHIPQPTVSNTERQKHLSIWQQVGFGFRYILASPGLVAFMVFTGLFWFAHDLGNALYSPMILARTNNNAAVLGSLSSAAGVGGVTGALLLNAWGGPKRRIHGMLLGFVGAGVSKTIFGLGQSPLIWLPAQFCSSLNFPLLGSSSTAILLAKVAPEIQGRIFAAQSTILQILSAIATLSAGLLADYLFEPAMMPNGRLEQVFGAFVGIGSGAGMALLYVTTSICLILVGLSGYIFRGLRDVEIIIPDHDAAIK